MTAHRHPIRVYYEDTDAGGIVYHASYLRFAERARTEALRDLAVPHQDLVTTHGLIFVVRRIKVDYLHPARPDEALVVVTRLREMGGASITLDQRVEDQTGAIRAVLEVVLVCISLAGHRPARVPPRWRDALSSLLLTKE